MSFKINYTSPISKALATAAGLSKDVELSSPPEDSISALSWSPAHDHLAAASWDGKVTLYDMTQNKAGEKNAVIKFEAPVLDCAWSMDGSKVVGAGADRTARLLDLNSGSTPQQVAAHEAPIRSVRWFNGPSNASLLVTGSWDKTVKYWDLRQASPAATLTFPERIYSMDVRDKLLVIATADRKMGIVDLNNPAVLFKTIESPLMHQTRVVSCFIDGSGFATGSIEGKCAFTYIAEKDESLNFAFRCHRTLIPKSKDSPPTTLIHTINAISFHPVHGTFSTAGSDGTFHFWDKDAHMRLKNYGPVDGPISATAFSRDGNRFAYAVSYDWSKGFGGNVLGGVNRVVLHEVVGDECMPKPGSVNKRRS